MREARYIGAVTNRIVAALVALLATALVLLALAGPAKAETFTVNVKADAKDANTADGVCDADATTAGQQCTLRAAVEQANNNNQADTVTFSVTNRITLPLGNLSVAADNGNALTIDGPGAGNLTVAGTNPVRARIFFVSLDADATIEGITIEGGDPLPFAGGGGGINNAGTLTVRNALVIGNTATNGGGIYSQNGRLKLENSTVHLNTGTINFGGIYISGNPATITGSTISGNETPGASGGIHIRTTDLTMTDSTVSGNTAGGSAGGINNSGGTLAVTGSAIHNNKADRGGGIFNQNRGTVNVTNSTVSLNEATSGGGVNNAGALNLANSTFSGNSTGVLNQAVDLVAVRNTIIANSAGANCLGAGFDSSKGSNLEDTDTCRFDQPSDRTNTEPQLGPLADNGGPTRTHALQAGSPAIDAVQAAGVPGAAASEPCGVTVDQRGIARPQDGNADGKAKCDIGSFELKGSATPPPPPPTKPKTGKPKTGKPKLTKKNPNACTIKGDGANNILRGTPGRDVICGFGGNDVIRGLGGNDLIRGGAGNDVIWGNGGNDRIIGGPGNDVLYGNNGNDALFGGRGRDVLLGGPGKNTLLGGAGRDVEKGGAAPGQNKKKARKLVNDTFEKAGLR